MALTWLSINASTGAIIADLPTLRADGALKATLMRYESQTVSLPTWAEGADDAPPPNWLNATREGAVFLVALSEAEDYEPRGLPLWGGMVVRRQRIPGGGVKMSLVTAEGWFDRVYLGDEPFTQVAQNVIVKTLVEKYATTTSTTMRGLPIRVEIVGGDGVLRDKTTWTDAADKTLYSALQDFSGIIGGPEWTVRWEWVDSQKLGLVLTVSDRIGSPPPPGLNPAAQFYLPGSVADAELMEGFGAEEGANDIMAVSSGVEAARPQSDRQRNTTDQRPRFEKRWTPDAGINDGSTLNDHAQRALAAMKDGSLALTLTANRKEAPKLGRDWSIGDDIGFSIEAPEFPGGLVGTARCVGWELTDTTVTPLIDVTNIEGAS
ncbi:MAG: hypothetical protein M3536_07875 [Actinomycetota bacterium]|nr:hypothetical protein [Actinomycetota bacterium]